MPSVDRAAICPPDRRGHSWREPTIIEQIEFARQMSPERHQLDAMRICRRCGRRGFINDMGLITLVAPTGAGA